MQTQRTPRQNWLITGSLFALTVLYVLGFYLPHKKTVRGLTDELMLKRQYISQSPQISAQMFGTQQQLDSAREYVDAWRKTSPSADGMSALFGDISHLIKTASVRTTRFEPSTTVEHQQLQQAPLAIGCTGSFSQIYQLLLGIERLPQSVWVDDLKIERKDANKEDLQCEIKLAIFADSNEISD